MPSSIRCLNLFQDYTGISPKKQKAIICLRVTFCASGIITTAAIAGLLVGIVGFHLTGLPCEILFAAGGAGLLGMALSSVGAACLTRKENSPNYIFKETEDSEEPEKPESSPEVPNSPAEEEISEPQEPIFSLGDKLTAPWNLADSRDIDLSGEEIAPLDVGEWPPQPFMKRQPGIGRYGSAYALSANLLTARLPREALVKFPLAIQMEFQDVENLELYFMIFKDMGQMPDLKRNLVPHPFLYHAKPLKDYQKPAKYGIFDAKGLRKIKHWQNAPLGAWKTERFLLHADGRLSPDIGRFWLQVDKTGKRKRTTSAFYCGIKDGKQRAVAFYTINIHDDQKGSGAAVANALFANSLAEFCEALENRDLEKKILSDVKNLFSVQP